MIRRLGHSSSRNIVSRNTVILAGITAFTVLAVWMIATGKGASAPGSTIVTPTVPSLLPPSNPSSLYKTQTNEGGNVTVAVTPRALAAGEPAVFQLVFDTHSVDLDFDVAAAAELRDDQGRTYGVAAWNGDPPGGHHRKGVLSFPTSLGQRTGITLTLTNIASIKERTFIWKLKESKGN